MTRRPITAPPSPHPRGSVLVFTLVILVLLALMGFSLMANTRSELHISHGAYQGRDAFAKADATARLALFMGRSLVSAASAGFSPCEIINNGSQMAGRPGFAIEVGDEDGSCGGFTLETVLRADTDLPTFDEIAGRYLQAVDAKGPLGSYSVDGEKPQVRVLYGGQVVGTAAVTIYSNPLAEPGGSESEGVYEEQGANSARVYVLVSADGRRPAAVGETNNYFSPEAPGDTVHSIVTTVYREIVVN